LSDTQIAKTSVVMKKAHKDKVLRQKSVAGCSLFKYRNNKAFKYEKEML